MTEVETLINTLIKNGLASSRSEAQRMADSMISTGNKVNAGMREQKDNYMVKDFKKRQKPTEISQAPITGSPQEQRIEELRRNAINPQPINVQTEFDTPSNDQKKEDFTAKPIEPSLPTAEPTVEIEHSNQQNNFSAEISTVETPVEQPVQPQLTPEEYAARQMNDMGAQTVSDLTSEPVSQVEEPISITLGSSLPVQEPLAEVPNDFIHQEPQQQEQQPSFEENSLNSLDLPSQEPMNIVEPSLPSSLEPNVPNQMSEQEFNPNQTQEPLEAQAPEQQQENNFQTQQENNFQTQQENNFQQEQVQEPVENKQPEKKRSGFSEEEQKLADDVDLSKVFNFSNK